MKKITVFLSLVFFILPLSASITIRSDIDENLHARLENAVVDAVGDRNFPDIVIEDVVSEGDYVRFTAVVGDRSFSFISPSDMLEEEIASLFFYEESLFSDGERLDYIYGSSFSSVTLEQAHTGENYRVYGASGKTEALMKVTSIHGEAVVFTPYYSSHPLPGMKIGRISDISLLLKFFSGMKFTSYGLSFAASSSKYLYPLSPLLEVSLMRSGNAFHALLHAGLSAEFCFSSVWPDVPVLRNLRLTGSAGAGGRCSQEGDFSLSSMFSLDLTLSVSRFVSVSVGLAGYNGENCVSLSVGGKL